PHLFRVQNLSKTISGRDYNFTHHLETKAASTAKVKNVTHRRLRSIKDLSGIVKVWINHLGEIHRTGEWS
ncbi:MAG: hypothetical protein WBA74_21770, partial [Cyclobacteriaceae bacterium]